MKKLTLLFILATTLLFISCSENNINKDIKMYTHTWDEIINNRNLDYFNEDRFDKKITLIMTPDNIVGIKAVKDFYKNYLTGFSDIKFTVINVFGQGDNIVKHWNFQGKHTGAFFGIPTTDKIVNIDGVTLVKMKNGKIAQEQDFLDNMVFMQQLGIVSNPNNLSVIQKLYNDFALGDVNAVGAALDPNIEWNEAEHFPFADGNPYIGFDAIVKGIFGRIGTEWDYWHLADLNYNEMANNKILVTGRYKAKYKKNGAVINLQMAHLWDLKDGKITKFQQFADTKGIVDAMKK
jgi:steroid delta-isomerase-like uncharacterized protein